MSDLGALFEVLYAHGAVATCVRVSIYICGERNDGSHVVAAARMSKPQKDWRDQLRLLLLTLHRKYSSVLSFLLT